MIGIGMLLQLVRRADPVGSIGLAVAGFGVLFVGLDTLRDAFEQLVTILPVGQLSISGPVGILLAVIAGALLTALVQSSSAALAIVLTASVSGVFTPLAGAAVVIGANIGTTVTALFSQYRRNCPCEALSRSSRLNEYRHWYHSINFTGSDVVGCRIIVRWRAGYEY